MVEHINNKENRMSEQKEGAIARAAIAAHLARQPKAEQPATGLEGENELISMARMKQIRDGIRQQDGMDGDDWDFALANAVAAYLARQAQGVPEGWVLAPKPRGRQSLAYLIQQASLACIENRVMEPDDRHEFAQYADLIRNSSEPPAGAQNADLLLALQKAARLLRAAGFAMTGTATSQIIAAINAAAVCTVPPSGWQCTRAAGHDGPCAAIPADISAQNAEAIRNAVLEEAANVLDLMNDSAGDRADHEQREMLCCENERMWTLTNAARAIRSLQTGSANTQEGAVSAERSGDHE
jgi:hypothetical protein